MRGAGNTQILVERELRSTPLLRSLADYWIWTVKSDMDREALVQIVARFSESPAPGRNAAWGDY